MTKMHEEMNKMGQNLPPGAFLLMFVSCVLVECVCVCACVCEHVYAKWHSELARL